MFLSTWNLSPTEIVEKNTVRGIWCHSGRVWGVCWGRFGRFGRGYFVLAWSNWSNFILFMLGVAREILVVYVPPLWSAVEQNEAFQFKSQE
jgi:hypothetical protein